jgi:hypothetical protein
LVEDGYRYRIARTPMGYLITARTRDPLGLSIVSEWLHQAEEAAIACMDAVLAWNAMVGTSDRLSEEFLMACQAATRRHNEICRRFDDPSRVGHEVQDLRKRISPE